MTGNRYWKAAVPVLAMLACSAVGVAAEQDNIRANPERLEAGIQALSQFGASVLLRTVLAVDEGALE
jgi:hypothetical protein